MHSKIRAFESHGISKLRVSNVDIKKAPSLARRQNTTNQSCQGGDDGIPIEPDRALPETITQTFENFADWLNWELQGLGTL